MDNTHSIIIRATVGHSPVISVQCSDGNLYTSDLKALSAVYCFPKSETEWKKVNIDSDGLSREFL